MSNPKTSWSQPLVFSSDDRIDIFEDYNGCETLEDQERDQQMDDELARTYQPQIHDMDSLLVIETPGKTWSKYGALNN